MIDIVKGKIETLDKEIQYHAERIEKAREAKILYEALIKEAELKSAATSTCEANTCDATEAVKTILYDL